MPKICYEPKKFKPDAVAMISQANRIIVEYAKQGFDLTLRQLYYQFVSRDLIANRQSEYKRLGSVINDARLAGLIDWNSIVDRTRNLKSLAHWDDEPEMIKACVDQFRVDKWERQTHRVEVWIEKDALAGVIERPCEARDVPYFSCRGYTSQSEMWAAAMRLRKYAEAGQTPLILHLGDHDPSGIDMSRDIQDRLRLFMEHHGQPAPKFKRLALNMDQVEEYNPPPNPAKITDSRAAAYIEEYGDESWELDALDPTTLSALIENAIDEVLDNEQWEEDVERETRGRDLLAYVAQVWPEIEKKFEEDGA